MSHFFEHKHEHKHKHDIEWLDFVTTFSRTQTWYRMTWSCDDILTNLNIKLMNAVISYLMIIKARLMNIVILDFDQNSTKSEDH
jgi:hypothetical protein